MSSRMMVYQAWAKALYDGVGKDLIVMGVDKDLGYGT